MLVEPNTTKKLIINRKQPTSETQEVNLFTSDFDSGQDLAILVRERVRKQTRRAKSESGYNRINHNTPSHSWQQEQANKQ